MSQLKKGALLSYVKIILTNVVGLTLTPFIVRSLGASEYGLYILIGSFIGYMSVFDLGLNNTVVRFVAKFRANEDKRAEEDFLGNTVIIFLGISLLIGLLGWGMYFNADILFEESLTPIELSRARNMIVLFVVNMAIILIGGVFTGICSAYEEFVFPRIVMLAKYVFRSLLVLIALLKGGKGIAIIAIDTVMNTIMLFINIYYVFRILKIRMRFTAISRDSIKVIFKYSVWILVFAMIGQLFWRSGQFILGVNQNTKVVAIYGVGMVLGGYFGAFAGAVNDVFLPKATVMVEKKSSQREITTMFIKIGRILTVFLLYIYGGFLLFGQQFIVLWVGELYKDAYTITLIMMTAYLLPLIQNFADSMIEARGKFKFKAKVHFITIGLGIVLGAYFSATYGYWAISIFFAGFWLISQVIMNWYYKKALKLDVKLFFKQTFGKIFFVLLISYALGYALTFIIQGTGWLDLMVKVLVFSTVYGVAAYFFMLNRFEKELIFKLKFLK